MTQHIPIDVPHDFVGSENGECEGCGVIKEVGNHNYYYTPEEKHVMVNVPGSRVCGTCGHEKDYYTHTQTSSSADTYRKPIAYRFDLIPAKALRRVAAIYEEGAQVYGPGKYIKTPMPHSNVVNHLMNHYNLAVSGDKSEDHWAKVAWAAFTMMVYEDAGIGRADLSEYGIDPDVTD